MSADPLHVAFAGPPLSRKAAEHVLEIGTGAAERPAGGDGGTRREIAVRAWPRAAG
jgi:hypothetical protein